MRVTSKGQVTIPKHVRDRLGIAPGDDIGFREEGQAMVIEAMPKLQDGESSGAKFARALIELGKRARKEGWMSGMSADEIMDMTRGPFDDVKPR